VMKKLRAGDADASAGNGTEGLDGEATTQ
jgi:hypothetical protein